ncbi:DMT family transporter [Aestuariicella hydrocarbonica]|uniref:DMT family transporter n=1 Tax=Pseudomaricurvus hydrocarbonicus TaxID=1470433 RepID=A0A9E5MPT6_9GAMM|nr:DMT family transporter [Aestuariicella hydrocarbonica]NHO68144.1 DMT family transporter [Aestuariicella hydrocarbonica]
MSSRLKGDGILILVTLIAAVGWLFSKAALEYVPAFWFIGLRSLIAGLLLGMIVYRSLIKLSRPQWIISVKTGLLFAVALLLWVQGLLHSDRVGEASFIMSLAVIMIPVAGRIVYGDRISRQLLLPLAMAVSGLGLLTLGEEIQLEISHLYLLAAALMFALQFVMTSRHVANIPPMALTAIQLTTVGIIGCTAAVIAALYRQETLTLNWGQEAWGWIIVCSLFTSLVRFALQIYAMKLTTATNAGMILVLEPVWTTLMGVFILNEVMLINQWMGCGLILASIVVFQLIRMRKWSQAARA